MAASAALVERTVPACSPAPLAPSTAPPPPKPPAMIAGIERFIATAIRFVRIEPDAPTIMPATISAGLLSAIARGRRGQAGEGVEHRDHDRHVGAADRQHDRVAEQRGAHEHADEQQFGVRARDEVDAGGHARGSAARRLTICWPAPSVIGRPGMISWSLPKAMFEPQKDTEPTIAANTEKIATYVGTPPPDTRHTGVDDRAARQFVQDAEAVRVRAVGGAVAAELRPRDQEHGAAAHAVEQRHHLRHRRHLHLARRGHADGRAERDAEHDQAPVALAGLQQRGDRPRSPCRPRRCGCRAPRSSDPRARAAPG